MPASVPEFRMSRARRAGDAVMAWLTHRGLSPSSTWVLTTTGRRTGLVRTVPVTVPTVDGERYLVAPYGEVGWVHNLRASGQGVLRRGREELPVRAEQVPAAEAGPVLKAYVRMAPPTRRFFTARVDDPVEAFVAEADRHPVFLLRVSRPA